MITETLTPLCRIRWMKYRDRRELQQAFRKETIQEDGTRNTSLEWVAVPDIDLISPEQISQH